MKTHMKNKRSVGNFQSEPMAATAVVARAKARARHSRRASLVELYARDASCTNNIAIIITIVTVDAIHQTQICLLYADPFNQYTHAALKQ